MALFKAKAKTAEEIMALIKGLPEEEIAKLGDMLAADESADGEVDGNATPESAEAQADGAEEQAQEQSADNGVDAQAEENGKEGTNAEAEGTEPQTENGENAEENGAPDKMAELENKIKSLESLVEGLTARTSADAENKETDDGKQEFGLEMQANGAEQGEESDLEKAKKKYWAM